MNAPRIFACKSLYSSTSLYTGENTEPTTSIAFGDEDWPVSLARIDRTGPGCFARPSGEDGGTARLGKDGLMDSAELRAVVTRRGGVDMPLLAASLGLVGEAVGEVAPIGDREYRADTDKNASFDVLKRAARNNPSNFRNAC